MKRALRQMVSHDNAPVAGGGLFALGQGSFGRYGNTERQSSDVKRVVRERLWVKRQKAELNEPT